MPDALINRTPDGWPYLDEDNYLDVVDNYTRELATKLQNGDAAANLVLTGWLTLPLPTGVTGLCRVRANGREVEFHADLTATITVGNAVYLPSGTVPLEFRPIGGAARLTGYLSGGHLGVVTVGAAGQIEIANQSGASRAACYARCLGWVRGS